MTACVLIAATTVRTDARFDHDFTSYAELLTTYVRGARVDYAALKRGRALLDEVTQEFSAPQPAEESAWTPAQRMAFWINAYNAFTLRAIVDHYPIKAGWFSFSNRNSIRQIDGVWTTLTWQAAGRPVTLDHIEHELLRPVFKEPRVHFAVNCASISCPPLAPQPYRASTLDAQLDVAAAAYLASAEGARLEGGTLRVSSIFKWYGDDFIARYAPAVPGDRPARERAILGVIVRHGPPPAAAAARTGKPSISYIDYNWSLNDAAGQ
jgi:hypothetical protein